MNVRAALKKVWHFIWEDNSIWSWIVNVILAFVIIKWILYPGMGLMLGTTHPIVAVVSGSMEHDGSFDKWWNSECLNGNKKTQAEIYESYRITKEQFSGFRFRNGFNEGDLMIIKKANSPRLGDVTIFKTDSVAEPVIHRIVGLNSQNLKTKGDHNCGSSGFEENIPQEKLIGRAVARIPYLGWIKILFTKIVQTIAGWW